MAKRNRPQLPAELVEEIAHVKELVRHDQKWYDGLSAVESTGDPVLCRAYLDNMRELGVV